MKTISIDMEAVADLSAELEGRQVLSASVGPAGEALLLATDVKPAWLSYPVSRADEPYELLIVGHDGNYGWRTQVRDEVLAHPTAQPLPDDELLVVGSRCRRFADGTYELNARVYGPDGVLRREFLLGDGIEHVQATSTGEIWVGYADEGIFGNFGWDRPVGEAGLLRFNSRGELQWEFQPPPGFGGIVDCYAVNVAGKNEVWAYYYTDFPVMRIEDGHVQGWSTQVSYASALAVLGDRVLLYGGYDPDRDRCLVGNLKGTRYVEATGIQLRLPEGEELENARFFGRGAALHTFVGPRWYRLSLHHL